MKETEVGVVSPAIVYVVMVNYRSTNWITTTINQKACVGHEPAARSIPKPLLSRRVGAKKFARKTHQSLPRVSCYLHKNNALNAGKLFLSHFT